MAISPLSSRIKAVVDWCLGNRAQLLLWVAITLLLVELSGVGSILIERIELWHFGMRQQTVQQDRRHQNITVVGLDDYSLSNTAIKELFGRFPFQRGVYGVAIDFFNRADVESVFFDLGFSGGNDQNHPDSDTYFVERINAATQLSIYSALVASTATETNNGINDELLNGVLSWQTIAYDALAPMLVLPVNTVQPPFKGLADSRMRFVFTNDAYHDVQGLVRFGGLFTHVTQQNRSRRGGQLKKSVAYPTVPLVLAMERYYQQGQPSGNSLLPLPDIRFHQRKTNTPLTWAWGETTQPHSVNFHQRHLPIIRWYGDMRGGYTSGGLYDAAEQFGINNPAKLLGPLGKTLLGSQFSSSASVSQQWQYRDANIYQKFSLWDVIYTQLTYQCGSFGSDGSSNGDGKSDYSNKLCNRFRQLQKSGLATGTLLNLEAFNNQTILVGTNYMNAPGDVHKTIYSGSNYPGVYIVANLLDNILSDDFVKSLPIWVGYVIAGVLALAIGFTSYTRPVIYSTAFTAFLLVAYTIATIWGYQEYNLWLPWAVPVLTGILAFVLSFGLRYWVTEHRKQQLRFAFGKYVSSNVMQTIEADPTAITLGGQRRELTFMFTDIRGFTTYSENNPPEAVQAVLTRYFKAMHHIILREHGGVINKLIGDAIMAYWGFPLAKQNDALEAVKSALAMRQTMVEWNENPENPLLKIGVGIHTGEAVIGNVGSEDFMDFTVIGDAVNLTSRLEGKTKDLLADQPCAILLSEATYQLIKDDIACRSLGEIQVKGKQEPITVYEPIEL